MFTSNNLNHAFTRVEYRLEIVDKSLGQKKALLCGLQAIAGDDTPCLNELLGWLQSIIADEEEPLEIPLKPSREVVEVCRVGAKVYQREKVKCGKASCKSCPHGPYWYGYQRRNKKVKSWYVGKDLKKEFQEEADDHSGSSTSEIFSPAHPQ